MTGTRLVAVGHFQPERVVPNSELETMVETSDEWIQRRVGIKERRWAAPEETVDVMAEKAALDTLAKGGMTADQVDLVIVATCSALDRSPNMAARVAHRLGIPGAPGHHRRQHRLLGLPARGRPRPARDRRGRLHHGAGDRLGEAHRRHRLHRPDDLRADRRRRRGVPAHRRRRRAHLAGAVGLRARARRRRPDRGGRRRQVRPERPRGLPLDDVRAPPHRPRGDRPGRSSLPRTSPPSCCTRPTCGSSSRWRPRSGR